MGATLTDVLLFGKAQSSDVNNGKFVIYRRNILRWGALGGYLDIIVKGVSPLSLPDAIANSLSYVKAFGGTEQNGTPTPDTPMDIVSNNGVLKARHQSGLPLGYTLLDYIESIGTQYIDTGAYISTGYKVRVKAYATSIPTTTAFFGCTSAAVASDAKKGIYRLIGGTINRCAWGNGNGSVVGNLSGNDAVNTWYDMVCDNGVWTINDTLFATCPESSFTSEYSMWLFARNTGGAVGLPAACRISVCQIWDNNGQMIRNLVPCKNASNVVGMYDLVNGVFYQNAGTGDFVAGTPVSDPVEIYTDGTVETLWMHSKNLFDEQWNRNTGVSTQAETWGQVVSATGWSTSGLVPVKAGQEYTVSYNTTVIIYIFYYEADGTMQQSYDTTTNTKKTFTVPAGATHIRLQVNKSTEAAIADLESQLETGDTNTTYAQYYDGGTATAEMLLKVGDYQDVQEILAGDVTRNVGVKVLDGTENWGAATTSGNRVFMTNLIGAYQYPLICTHFVNGEPTTDNIIYIASGTQVLRIRYDTASDQTAFKSWLATQYAAGTPVIVVYPLAEPTTEVVAGQTLQVTQGDNMLEITQASLSGLELEAQYKKGVVASAQEVEP